MSSMKEMFDTLMPKVVENATAAIKDKIEAELDKWEIAAAETANPWDDLLVKLLRIWLKR